MMTMVAMLLTITSIMEQMLVAVILFITVIVLVMNMMTVRD